MESSGEEQNQHLEQQEQQEQQEQEEEMVREDQREQEFEEEDDEEETEEEEEEEEEAEQEEDHEGLHIIFKVELDGEFRRCRLILNETVTAEGITALVCQLFHLPVGALRLRFRDSRDQSMRCFLPETWDLAIDCARNSGGLLWLNAARVETESDIGDWEVLDEGAHSMVETSPTTRTLTDLAAQAYRDSAPLRAQFMTDFQVAKSAIGTLSEDGGRMLWHFGSMVGAAAGRQAANFGKKQEAGKEGLWSSSSVAAAAFSGMFSSGSQSAAPGSAVRGGGGITLGPQPRSQQVHKQERPAQTQEHQGLEPQAPLQPELPAQEQKEDHGEETRQLRMEEEQRQQEAMIQKFYQQHQKQQLKQQKATEKAERKARKAQRRSLGSHPEDTLCLDEYEHVLGKPEERPGRSKLVKPDKKREAASSPSMSPIGTCRSEDSVPEVVVPCLEAPTLEASPRLECRSARSMTEETTISSMLASSSSDSFPQEFFELAWNA